MGRRRAAWLFLAVVCVVSGLLIFRGNRNLVYQRHAIGYWFERLPVTLVTSNSVMTGGSVTTFGQTYGSTVLVTETETYKAFDHFGTNAIPYLMSKFLAEDSYAKSNITMLAVKLGVRKMPFRFSKIERGQAVTALLRLDLPEDCLQSIIYSSTNGVPDIAASAKYILRTRQREAKSTAP